MEGDLTQLKAKNYTGLDKYLSTSENEIKNNQKFVSLYESSFESMIKPTNISINTRKVGPSSVLDFGQKVKFIIPRYGDKIGDVALEIKLPTLTDIGYVNTIGYALIEYVEIVIGDITITKHTDIWLDIHDKLMTKADYLPGIDEMVLRFNGHTDTSFTGGTVLIPLKFWFCGVLTQSFPLIALSHQDLIIYVKIRQFDSIWISNSNKKPNKKYSIESGNMLVDYIRLDKYERQYLYQKKRHQFLIKQVQVIDYEIGGGIKRFKASLDSIKYPVIELIWVFRNLDRITLKDYYNYSYNDLPDNDIFDTANLTFGEKERIEHMFAKYYRIYQPYKRHSNMPNDYIYNYSFAAKPESETMPSGTCNFSEISDKNLNINFNVNIPDTNLYIFAVNYNILIIEDGYAWLEKCNG